MTAFFGFTAVLIVLTWAVVGHVMTDKYPKSLWQSFVWCGPLGVFAHLVIRF